MRYVSRRLKQIEFDETNQSTLSILSSCIEDVNVLQPLAEATTQEETQALIGDACVSFFMTSKLRQHILTVPFFSLFI